MIKIYQLIFLLVLLVAAEDLNKLPLFDSKFEVNICFNNVKEKYYWAATTLTESRTGISSSLVSHDLYKDSINARLDFIIFAKVNNYEEAEKRLSI